MVSTEQATLDGVRRVSAAFGLIVLTVSAVFGASPFGVRERLLGSAVTPVPVALSREARPDGTGGIKSDLRSQPWWQSVRTFSSAETTTAPTFVISANALQWRATWSCQSGHLVVSSLTKPRHALVDAACPGSGIRYATATGAATLQVGATGGWKLQIDQQVDAPLEEPPLPAMNQPGAAPIVTGSFYRIDQVAVGTVTIYYLPDGSFALRLRDFYVTPNSDLEVRLSTSSAPHSTDEFAATASMPVSYLDVTAGSLNFVVPSGVDPTRYRSVVLWCDRLHSAYGAAALVALP